METASCISSVSALKIAPSAYPCPSFFITLRNTSSSVHRGPDSVGALVKIFTLLWVLSISD